MLAKHIIVILYIGCSLAVNILVYQSKRKNSFYHQKFKKPSYYSLVHQK
jgi:hypothetical protein